MICKPCQEAAKLCDGVEEITLEAAKQLHLRHCKGGTHCDCQHKPTVAMPDGSRAQRRK